MSEREEDFEVEGHRDGIRVTTSTAFYAVRLECPSDRFTMTALEAEKMAKMILASF